MSNEIAAFAEMDWSTIAPSAREKRFDSATGPRLRMLELSGGFAEDGWCQQAHFGIVLEGELQLEFEGRAISLRAGDGLAIPAGAKHRHRALVQDRALLFLVEPTDEESE